LWADAVLFLADGTMQNFEVQSRPLSGYRSGMSTTYVTRRATPQDAAVLSELGARTFSETFAHLYPPEDLSCFLADAYSLERTLDYLTSPEHATWILEGPGGLPVGFALAGPCSLPHAEVTADGGELKRIYILAAHRGGGRGTALLTLALDWLEQDGPKPLWIGVWSGNHQAQKLYAKLGFVQVGGYGFPVGKTIDDEFILRRLPETG
jgi:ribosomal protein S18 acetylase RimI-like enzyme